MKIALLTCLAIFTAAFIADAQEIEEAPQPDAAAGSVQNEGQAARATAVSEREIVTRLQIFLDQQGFGPGKIDGRWGEFTGKALGRYAKVHGLTADETIYEHLKLEEIEPIYTTYEILERDLAWVGDVPSQPAQQAKQKKMPYRSLLEFLEERFHCDPDLLRRINPDVDALKPGDVVWVPNVKPFKVEELKEIARLPEVPEFGQRSIYITTKTKMLDLYEGNALIASFPITPGSSTLPAPPGRWNIVGITIMPWFRHDESMLNKGVRSDDFHNIPPGPNNPVGVVWIGLNKRGIGVHGTNSPQTIGRSASHGCIRLANWDAIRLAYMVTQKTPVTIE